MHHRLLSGASAPPPYLEPCTSASEGSSPLSSFIPCSLSPPVPASGAPGTKNSLQSFSFKSYVVLIPTTLKSGRFEKFYFRKLAFQAATFIGIPEQEKHLARDKKKVFNINLVQISKLPGIKIHKSIEKYSAILIFLSFKR